MKLRNKKTGEIRDFIIKKDKIQTASSIGNWEYTSLANLCKEWEDAPEEPKEYWFINPCGEAIPFWEDEETLEDTEASKEIGDYFETREEAEKAVEKLKALKRLKDNGFEFEGWTIDDGLRISICTNFDSDGIYDDDKKEMKKDLDLLFGGEE